MDLTHQLPCALNRLRTALPLKSRASVSQRRRTVNEIASFWGNSCTKPLPIPGGLERRYFCCSGFGFDRSREVLRVESSNISGFRVYSRILYPKRRGFLSTTDEWHRFAWHFAGRNFCCSCVVTSSPGPLVVVTAGRSEEEAQNGLGVDSRSPGKPESDLEHASRRKKASAKRQVRTSTTPGSKVGKTQQRTIQAGGSSSTVATDKCSLKTSGDRVPSRNSDYQASRIKTDLSRVAASQDEPELFISGTISHFGRTAAETAPRESMNSRQRPNPDKQGAGESKQKQQNERKPRKKDYPVEALLRRDLNMCSKDGDVLRALEIYDRSAAEGIVKWNQYNFNILLYLCSSAAIGTLTARKSGTDRQEAERLNLQPTDLNLNGEGPTHTNGSILEQQESSINGACVNENGPSKLTPIVLSPEVMELAAKRGFEIYEDMKRQEVPPNEATLTAVARLAVRTEDGDLAFQMVKEMAALNIAPKLRSYSPALVIFCKNKLVEKAFAVDAHMLAASVQPEETELGALLRLCVELGLEKKVYSLLHRLRARVRELSPSTVAIIEDWFSGKVGASAGQENKQPDNTAIRQALEAGGGGWHGLGWVGKGDWKLEWTNIDRHGLCCSCNEQLVTIDIDPQETDTFAQSLSELASSREAKPNDFKRFQEWLERHGPFDAIVDGANVGLYNQNFSQGGFNFFQLNSIVRTAQEQGLAKKPPLVVLHHARTRFGAANSALGQQVLQKWGSMDTLYTTPNGSNDDWYWLYAAVKNKCLLITNDEMRDHLFQLLGTDFFPKWKERHQVRFSATSRGPQFHLPPPYSLVIQESGNGSWHIPKSGGNDIDAPREWLCVTRPELSSKNSTSPDFSRNGGPAENLHIPAQTSDEMGMAPEKDSVSSDSPESNGTHKASVNPKRSRELSPSTTLRKIKTADRRSNHGPITFDI